MLHSRVARSNVLAFTRMGARVTVCGPPTLIPRDAESLGCEVAYDLARLGEADVVYALRMQRERMATRFVPSLREYVACYQIDGRRLEPRQLLMHPGPVNRGVELAAEVIDSPQALIVDQVASGLVVRMAILYELLSGGGEDGATRRPHRRRWSSRRELRARASPARPRLASAQARSPPDDLLLRSAHLLDPRAGIDGRNDLLVREGEIAEIALTRRDRARRRTGGDRGGGTARLSRLRRPPRASSHSRARGRGGPRLRHPGRRGRRLLLRARDAEHRSGHRQRAGAAVAARARRASRRACRSVSWRRSRAASRGPS